MDDDIDLVHKLCEFTEGGVSCYKQAGYGPQGGAARLCGQHKGLTDVGTRWKIKSRTTMVLRSATAVKEAQHVLCSSCGGTPQPPAPPPPPTESFFFCMNTPWWSSRGPTPNYPMQDLNGQIDALYGRNGQQLMYTGSAGTCGVMPTVW